MAEQPGKGWSSTAPLSEFKPFIPHEQSPAEFTLRAIFLGAVFGVLFGAVTVYVGLRAGLTVSASIPIAVLSISILRAFGRATILENNIVQTIGSAGESVAAGVIFTLPALIFLGFQLEYSRIFLLAMIGGWKARPAPTCWWPASAVAASPGASSGDWAWAAPTPS